MDTVVHVVTGLAAVAVGNLLLSSLLEVPRLSETASTVPMVGLGRGSHPDGQPI